MQSYFFFMQGEKHERAILKGECPVDIQVREPLAVAKPGHRRGFLTLQKGKRTSRKCEFIIELFPIADKSFESFHTAKFQAMSRIEKRNNVIDRAVSLMKYER